MSRVKGSLFVHFVKTVRANKQGVYDAYLTEEDHRLIEGRVLPSSWYPFETYKRFFQAVAREEVRDDPVRIQRWGREFCEEIMLSIYKRMLTDTTPMQTLRRYSSMFSMFYDFGTLELEELGPREAVLAIRDFDPDFEELYQLIYGWVARSLELSGGRDVVIEFRARSWRGAPDTQYHIRWQE